MYGVVVEFAARDSQIHLDASQFRQNLDANAGMLGKALVFHNRHAVTIFGDNHTDSRSNTRHFATLRVRRPHTRIYHPLIIRESQFHNVRQG